MSPKKAKRIYQVLAKIIPNPTTELKHSSPFELLVAVILSAQATDISVNRATDSLFEIANTPVLMRKLGLRKLKNHIKSIGLYNTKAEHILRASHIIEKTYNGVIPSNREGLESLPGVGRKTANVVLNTAFGMPTIAVDTHIFRVANRTGLAAGGTVLEVEKGLLKITPREYLQNAHHLLILHGRYTCTARKPRCNNCPIYQECGYKDKLTL